MEIRKIFLIVLIFSCFSFSPLKTLALVHFTNDVILSLSGISDGSLYVASSSYCDSLSVSGANLTVSGIPDGYSFILKTPYPSIFIGIIVLFTNYFSKDGAFKPISMGMWFVFMFVSVISYLFFRKHTSIIIKLRGETN